MKRSAVLHAICGSLVLAQTPASIVNDNQAGITYSAQLTSGVDAALTGSVTGTTSTNGSGVQFEISFGGFDPSANYTYHIHQHSVPNNGDCNATGDHLDPTALGPLTNKNYACNPAQPQLCQVGDLSGKHGIVHNASGLAAVYIDEYLSTTQGNAAFFGDLSVVMHLASSNARLRCGNFVLNGPSNITALTSSSTISTQPTVATSTPAASTPAATQASSSPSPSASAPSPIPVASAASFWDHSGIELLFLLLAIIMIHD